MIEEVKAQRKAVEAIIMAEKFDRAAYDKAVDSMLDTRDQITRKRAAIMGDALVDLPVADRKKFSKRVLDGLSGGRKGGGYHHKMAKDGQRGGDKETGKQP